MVGFPKYVHIKQSVHGGRIYEATFIVTSFRLTLDDRRPLRTLIISGRHKPIDKDVDPQTNIYHFTPLATMGISDV